LAEEKKNSLKEITDQLEQGIKDVYSSDRYREYLKVMSRFHNYSFNNSILIMMQNPEATLVAGYKSWQTKFQRQVKKGEKGISIIAPAPYKIKVSEEVKDPSTHKPILDTDGKPVMAEREITIQQFRVVKVFDISQTTGEPIPMLAESLAGDVDNYPLIFKSIKAISPVPVKIEKFATHIKGYFSPTDNEIVINDGMSQAQNVKTLIHEVAHAFLHGNREKDLSREKEEVEAESIAFIVCNHLGIDTSSYSFDYLATWSSGKELSELKQSLGTIQKAASQLISEITASYKDLCKEQKERLAEESLNTVRHDGEIDLDREKKRPPEPTIADRIVAAQEIVGERVSSSPQTQYEKEAR
jgi:antirestriction protein ArdC